MPQPIKTPAKRPMLEPEAFLRSDRLQEWFLDNVKTVVAVAGVLVLAAAAWGVVAVVQHRAEERAADLYAAAINTYEQAQAPERQLRVLSPETKEILERANTEFQKVRDEYPRTRYAALALFQQANAYAALDRHDDAIGAYQAWLSTHKVPDLVPLVTMRLGYALWAKGNHEDALGRFEEVAKNTTAPNRDLAHFEIGRLFEHMGQKEKALDAYATLAREYRSSPWSSEGNARIIALGGTPPGLEPDVSTPEAGAEAPLPAAEPAPTPPPQTAQ